MTINEIQTHHLYKKYKMIFQKIKNKYQFNRPEIMGLLGLDKEKAKEWIDMMISAQLFKQSGNYKSMTSELREALRMDNQPNIKQEIKKEKKNGTGTHISTTMRFEIYQRDEFRCHWCKKHKDQLRKDIFLSLDHKIPISKGGDDSFNNLVTACTECNNGKRNKIVKEK